MGPKIRAPGSVRSSSATCKKLVAELCLDKAILQDINSKKMARPALKRPVVEYIRDHYGVPRRRACRLVGLHRSVFYYQSVKNPRLELRGRMRELARTRVRYGYRRFPSAGRSRRRSLMFDTH